MSKDARIGLGVTWRDGSFMALSCLLAGAGAITLVALLWKYVPAHALAYECLDASLPLITRLAIFASNLIVRLLPFLIMLGVPLVGGIIVLGAILADCRRWSFPRILGTLAFAVAIAEGIACCVLIYAIHAGYRSTGCDPLAEGGPPKCQECRVK